MILYNSLSRKNEEFVPLQKGRVKLYVCGITPYDTAHLGHAFTYVEFDVLIRFLRFSGYEVVYAQNVTDVDDDILRKAKEEKKDWKELGDFWIKRFLDDMDSLNVLRPTNFVKATDSIPTMIKIIDRLLDKNIAYKSDGNVYFDINKFTKYGSFSRLSETEMIALSKERGANPNDPLKKHPLDFILWQKSLTDEPKWDSPFGQGRPGWHIECSAMNLDFLGEQIDIHGGGKDLMYPHHESEIAQSESFTGKSPFAKFWMHIGMVEYQGDKMSKSLGNLVLVKDLLKKYSPNAIRFLLLSHNYKNPWEFTMEKLNAAEENIELIKNNLHDGKISKEAKDALSNNLNTPQTLKILKNNPTTALFNLLGFKS